MLILLFLLLPMAALSGWMIGKRKIDENSQPLIKNADFNATCLSGLNYLLNEEPDKAVDTFIKILTVDSETVETHLALGFLFRRRGEVDRAIRIHQNLIARPQLSPLQRTQALLALAQDYFRAGVLDRAERFFLEVIERGSDYELNGLNYLLDIYQQQKRWESAIQIGKKIFVFTPTIAKNIAHYYCELAIGFTLKQENEDALRYINYALEWDKQCIRAHLLKAEFLKKEKDWGGAIAIYKKIAQYSSDFIVEILPSLRECYSALSLGEEKLLTYFFSLLETQARTSLILATVTLLKEQNPPKAIPFLIQQLHRRPSLRALYELLNLYAVELKTKNESTLPNIAVIKNLMAELIKNKSLYRCVKCGFKTKQLMWFCPGCRNWSSIKPIQGVEGE